MSTQECANNLSLIQAIATIIVEELQELGVNATTAGTTKIPQKTTHVAHITTKLHTNKTHQSHIQLIHQPTQYPEYSHYKPNWIVDTEAKPKKYKPGLTIAILTHPYHNRNEENRINIPYDESGYCFKKAANLIHKAIYGNLVGYEKYETS